jgi:tRNA G46 methylase TrmB
MANRGSNRQRNLWVVSVLDPRPTDRMLEIGFGPGIAIAAVARRVTHGRVYGADHSDPMVRKASRRLALASQPRMPGANAGTTARAASELADRLLQAGFGQPRTEILDLDPPVACVLATNP